MSSNDPDPDDLLDSPSTTDSLSPPITIHSLAYPPMSLHMYPYPQGLVPTQPLRLKRRQVKNACTNCQKACKKCDDARPCLRCVKYGVSEECVDSQRKERRKGIKRGPYKKRDGKGNASDQVDDPQGLPINGVPVQPAGPPPTAPYMGPVGYPPGYFGQYPPPSLGKPGEAPNFYPQFFITSVPPPPPPSLQHNQEGDAQPYPPQSPHQFYSTTFLAPYAQPYPSYVVARPDAQVQMPPAPYTYPSPVYGKQPVEMGIAGDHNGVDK
ncbi:hypothetical protein ARMSODRAFT_946675 [Armillaria solidipes]|uniref:Transcription activator of gluconeogenesis ERT1 n=1 Tax=Armillaria solidipes TaxID=1076256 RepID=A0A2H3CF15_9AGAR|nr:hypothetical protein ARMSODRAFT_946675 [Armillaria solidipes]